MQTLFYELKKALIDHIETTDNQLIELFQKTGKKSLMGILFKRYMSLVYGVCLKYLKNREESKDMTMQVFEKLLLDLQSKQVLNFKGWLYVVTKNECLMLLRKKQRLQRDYYLSKDFMEFKIAKHHVEGDDPLESKLAHMNACLERLKQEQNTCIKLFYLEKKTYEEVSKLTGYEMVKVKSYLQNGRRNLKLCIERLSE